MRGEQRQGRWERGRASFQRSAETPEKALQALDRVVSALEAKPAGTLTLRDLRRLSAAYEAATQTASAP